MARIEIKHKCVTMAREAARRDSRARSTGRSVYIKRYHGEYRLIGVKVTDAQRTCRDIFADAQKLAQRELKTRERRRYWLRTARKNKVKGAHRMAVSYFYKLLKANGGELKEELMRSRTEKLNIEGGLRRLSAWKRMDSESPFFYRKFGDIEEYYGVVRRLAA